MATQPISMNIIKQVLIRLSQKESIRSIASALHISKNTVSRYKSIAEADPLTTRELIALEDTVLNHRFNGGNPAYCDERMEVLKELLPALEKELKNRMSHRSCYGRNTAEITPTATACRSSAITYPSI